MFCVGGNDSRRQTQARFSAHERPCRRRHRRHLHRPRAVDETTGSARNGQGAVDAGRARRAPCSRRWSGGVRRRPRSRFFVLGTTIATNCLLERTGQRTLYLTTAGLRGRAVHPAHRPQGRSTTCSGAKPTPYVRRRDCIGVARAGRARRRRCASRSRTTRSSGVVAEVRAASRRGGGVAVAINLLFSYVDARARAAPGRRPRGRAPGRRRSRARSEVAPIWREYERGNTVIVDAYLRRLIGRFADGLDEGLTERRAVAARASCSSPTAARSPPTRRPASRSASCSPGWRAGLIAGSHFADAAGLHRRPHARHGRHERRRRRRGRRGDPLGGPVRVRVGPADRRARRRPDHDRRRRQLDRGLRPGRPAQGRARRARAPTQGPPRTGKGGTEATVTDANLVLGRLNPDYFLGGAVPLDARARPRAVGSRSADAAAQSLEDAAHAIIGVACENMANAMRLLCADRGLDYRALRPVAFGGAGPLHAARARAPRGARRRRRAAQPGAGVGVRRPGRRPARRPPPDAGAALGHRHATPSCATRSARVAGEALDELRGEGAAPPTPTLSGQRRAAATSGRTSSRRSPCRSTPADDAGRRCWSSASTSRTRPCTATASPAPWWSSCTSTRLRPNGATPIPRRRRSPGRRPSPIGVRPVYFERTWVETPIYRRAPCGAGTRSPGRPIIEEVDSTTLVLRVRSRRARHVRGALISRGRPGEPGRGGAELSDARPGLAQDPARPAREHLRGDGARADAHVVLADLQRGPRLLRADPRPARRPRRDGEPEPGDARAGAVLRAAG